MDIWIVIAIIVGLFIFAISPYSFGKWAKGSWRDLHDVDPWDEPSDLEIRAFYRKLAFENIPHLGPNAILKFHDEDLDNLIAYASFDEANDYRIIKVKLHVSAEIATPLILTHCTKKLSRPWRRSTTRNSVTIFGINTVVSKRGKLSRTFPRVEE